MFLRIFYYAFFTLTLVSFKVNAGWPEDGWIGVKAHSVPAAINQAHKQLAQDEECISKTLPSSNINLVLANLSFHGQSPEEYKEVLLEGSLGKTVMFESGWMTTLNENPVPQVVQRLVRPYAAQLQKAEGLDAAQQQELASSVCGISEIMRLYQMEIFPRFESYESSVTVSEILNRARTGLAGADDSSFPDFPLFQSLKRDGQVYKTKTEEIERERAATLVTIDKLNQKLQSTQSLLDTESLLKDLEKETRRAKEELAKRKRELETVGSKVIATYWHSEQKFLKFLEDSMEAILSQVTFQNLGFSPKAIVLQLHSRFDICSFCSHVLARALTQPDGVLEHFRQTIVSRLELNFETPLYLTASFREERNHAQGNFTVGHDSYNGFEDLDQMKQKPAFPLMHIPNPSE